MSLSNISLKEIINSHACMCAANWLDEILNDYIFYIFQGIIKKFRMQTSIVKTLNYGIMCMHVHFSLTG